MTFLKIIRFLKILQYIATKNTSEPIIKHDLNKINNKTIDNVKQFSYIFHMTFLFKKLIRNELFFKNAAVKFKETFEIYVIKIRLRNESRFITFNFLKVYDVL